MFLIRAHFAKNMALFGEIVALFEASASLHRVQNFHHLRHAPETRGCSRFQEGGFWVLPAADVCGDARLGISLATESKNRFRFVFFAATN